MYSTLPGQHTRSRLVEAPLRSHTFPLMSKIIFRQGGAVVDVLEEWKGLEYSEGLMRASNGLGSLCRASVKRNVMFEL